MHLDCPHCGQALEFSGKRPSFCAYCGKAIDSQQPSSTATLDPNAPTLAPDPGSGRAEPPPEILGGYRLLNQLGAGGMGTVFEAEEMSTCRHVALKMIAAEHATSPESVERFRREGRLASAVVDPRCVFVLAADEDSGRPYIVMELMPGTTLKDVVDRRGPMPPKVAVAKILDVIDGLRAAHRLGVVHRDVKPSNCFVEANGRVKIGDFGLSKSLVRQVHLTQTGAFLGTPQFAAPEQVRGETVDQQTDLYAVAATLYYLLTGKAPFESNNAAITLARIVADPTPPLRTLRPELPQALDDVVLRGLERDRQRRWRDLDEFRAALQPFLPGWQETAGLGVRFGAYLIDALILQIAGFVVALGVLLASGRDLTDTRANFWHFGLGVVPWILLFLVPETIWGCSVGKWALGLRVRLAARRHRAGLGRIALRTLVFYMLVNLGALAVMPILLGAQDLSGEVQTWRAMVFIALFYPLEALGIGLIFVTMRTHNGYRGMHEFASGTRVVRAPVPEVRRPIRAAQAEQALEQPPGMPERLGGYVIRGALRWDESTKVLLGEDPALERRVAIRLRPATQPPLEDARRALTRTTRLRWLGSGTLEAQQWDAFMAPTGTALPDVVAGEGPLSWSEVQLVLDQLAAEQIIAVKDGTLPAMLGADQVLIQSNGQIEILDWPLQDDDGQALSDESDQVPSRPGLALLAEVAVLSLEGRARPLEDARGRRRAIRALLPLYAADLLARLLEVRQPYRNVQEFQAELLACRDRPAQATAARRAAALALSVALLGLAMSCCMIPAGWAPGLVSAIVLTVEFETRSQILRDLEEGAWSEAAVATVNPNPLVRLRGVAQLQADLRLRDELKKTIDDADRERETRLATDWLLKAYLQALDKEMRKQKGQGGKARWAVTRTGRISNFRLHAKSQLLVPNFSADATHFFGIFFTIWLLFWPVVWVIWAFLWRGGLSLRWLGLALARSDGRKAARWQCAWRGLVVWTPITALWIASLWLDIWSWSAWRAGQANTLLQWLSSGCWWAGVALLPVYAVLAIIYPRRSLHDWLSGTYVVPR
jgi:eukaryotic-like serine/threonine-protein kinase